jgi:hypothetical protein
MKTLKDAWDWYESAKKNLQRMHRLGIRHWNDDSLAGASIWIVNLTAGEAFGRLKDFLDTLDIAVEAELKETAEDGEGNVGEAPG